LLLFSFTHAKASSTPPACPVNASESDLYAQVCEYLTMEQQYVFVLPPVEKLPFQALGVAIGTSIRGFYQVAQAFFVTAVKLIPPPLSTMFYTELPTLEITSSANAMKNFNITIPFYDTFAFENPGIPINTNTQQWAGYGIFATAIGVGGMATGLVLFIIMLLFCPIWCIVMLIVKGQQKKKWEKGQLNSTDDFKRNNPFPGLQFPLWCRIIPSVLLILAVVVPLFLTWLGTVYNFEVGVGINKVFESGKVFVEDVDTFIDANLDAVNGIVDSALLIVTDLNDTIYSLNDVLIPVQAIVDEIGSLVDSIEDLSGSLTGAVGNLSLVTELLGNMTSNSLFTGSNDSIPTSIPSIPTESLSTVTDAFSSMGVIKEPIALLYQTAQMGVQMAIGMAAPQLAVAEPMMKDTIAPYIKLVNDSKAEYINTYITPYVAFAEHYVAKYDGWRKLLTAGLFLLPLLIFSIGICTALCNFKQVKGCASVCATIYAIILMFAILFVFIAFGFHYLLGFVLGEFCQHHKTVTDTLLQQGIEVYVDPILDPMLHQNLSAAGFNISVNIDLDLTQVSVESLMGCSGNQNVMQLFGVLPLMNSIKADMIKPIFDMVHDQIGSVDTTGPIDAAKETMNGFANITSFDFGAGFNMTELVAGMSATIAVFNNISNFDFNQSAFDSILGAINAMTCPLAGSDSGDCLMYNATNITLLNTHVAPYTDAGVLDSLKKSINDTKAQFLTAKQQFDDVQAAMAELQAQAAEAQAALEHVETGFAAIGGFGTLISTRMGAVSGYLDEISAFTANVVSNITNLINGTEEFVDLTLNDIADMTKCSWFGSLYTSVVDEGVCVTVQNSLEIVASAALLLGASMFITYFVACAGCYSIGRVKVKSKSGRV